MGIIPNLRFGVEVEFTMPSGVPRSAVARDLTAAGISCRADYRGSSHHDDWKIVIDGSISGNGMELVSPVLTGEAGLDLLTAAVAKVRALGGLANKTCGLHVHVDGMPVPAMRRLAMIYVAAEAAIDKLMPESRRGNKNQYCRSLRQADLAKIGRAGSARDIADALRSSGEERRVKLNFASYWKHGTIEFRHAAGTVDPEKVRRWVVMCLRMRELAEREANQPAAESRRPEGSRLVATAYDMIRRPEGASPDEIRVALGHQKNTSWGFWFRRHGVGYRKTRGRYYFDQAAVTTMTLPALLDKLGVDEEERTYWAARAARLALDEAAQRRAA